jgi:hypothetical protein
MAERQMTTKAELLAETERSWSALNAAIARMTESQITTLKDEQGWTIKDHIIHLAAWERSVVFFLQGKPRHEGLGVDEAIYRKGDDDAINAVIQKQRSDMSLSQALAELRNTHAQLLALLEPLTDDDLSRRYRHYLPDEPGDGDGPPAMNVIKGNSASHFAEHLAWIEALASTGERTK